MKKGRFIVLSGPSGVGKGTICNALINELDAWYSVSMTTRGIREGEVDGVNYYFVSKEEFLKNVITNSNANVGVIHIGTIKQDIDKTPIQGYSLTRQDDSNSVLTQNRKRSLPMQKTVCVITGGGSGMGLEAAKFMPKDKIIVISGRTLSKLEGAVKELEALGYLEQPHTSAGRVPSATSSSITALTAAAASLPLRNAMPYSSGEKSSVATTTSSS